VRRPKKSSTEINRPRHYGRLEEELDDQVHVDSVDPAVSEVESRPIMDLSVRTRRLPRITSPTATSAKIAWPVRSRASC